MTVLDDLKTLIGPAHVLTGADAAAYGRDWTGDRRWQPLAVVRPANRDEVAGILRHCLGSPSAGAFPAAGAPALVGGDDSRGRADACRSNG